MKLNLIKDKKGTEWTISKLVSLILLIIIIVLVVVGFSTGMINPLKNKIVGIYDEVMYWFGWGEDGGGRTRGDIQSIEAEILGRTNEVDINFDWGECGTTLSKGHVKEYGDSLGYDSQTMDGIYGDISGDYSFRNGQFRKWGWSSERKFDWITIKEISSESQWKKNLYDSFLTASEKFVIDFEGQNKKPGFDKWAGLTLDTSKGVYAFGRDHKGISVYDDSNIVLRKYNNGWEDINRKSIDLRADKDFEWMVYNAFLDFSERKRDESNFYVDYGGKQYLNVGMVRVKVIEGSSEWTTMVVYINLAENFYGFDLSSKAMYVKYQGGQYWESFGGSFLREDSTWYELVILQKIKDDLYNACPDGIRQE